MTLDPKLPRVRPLWQEKGIWYAATAFGAVVAVNLIVRWRERRQRQREAKGETRIFDVDRIRDASGR